MQGVRAEMRQAFPAHLYGRRVLIESRISAVNRKLSARALDGSLLMQWLQTLLLRAVYNISHL